METLKTVGNVVDVYGENNTIKNSLLIVNSISELIEYIGYKKTKEDFYELSSDGSIENVDICIGILNQYINQIE